MATQDLNTQLEFILKIAQAPNLTDGESVEAIASTLNDIQYEKVFNCLFDRVDPGQHFPETKLLDEKARERLSKGIEFYGVNYVNQNKGAR